MQQDSVMTEEQLNSHPSHQPGNEANREAPRPRLTMKYLYGLIETLQDDQRKLSEKVVELSRLIAEEKNQTEPRDRSENVQYDSSQDAQYSTDQGTQCDCCHSAMNDSSPDGQGGSNHSVQYDSNQDAQYSTDQGTQCDCCHSVVHDSSPDDHSGSNHSVQRNSNQAVQSDSDGWAIAVLPTDASQGRPPTLSEPVSMDSILQELQEAARIADEIAEHAATGEGPIPLSLGKDDGLSSYGEGQEASLVSHAHFSPILTSRAERHQRRKRSFWSRLFGRRADRL